jgi:hypothetical protein
MGLMSQGKGGSAHDKSIVGSLLSGILPTTKMFHITTLMSISFVILAQKGNKLIFPSSIL